MILRKIDLSETTVDTHRDSHMLSHLSVISVRRPFFAPSLVFALGGGGFVWSFSDLLYAGEKVVIIGALVTGALVGLFIAQIQLLSRDLRGSELSGMIWGTYGHLN